MQKFSLIFTAIAIILVGTPVFADAIQPTDTDGNGYYNISTLDHLRWVSENDSCWSWNFELDNDIDAGDTKNWNDGLGWFPIGNEATRFKGKFNGNGYAIDSIYINRPSQEDIGLFGIISGVTCEIRSLGVTNCVIRGGSHTAGLVGINRSGTVSNSYTTGSVEGYASYTGGLVGENWQATIDNSYASVNIHATGDYTGGLVGLSRNCTAISNSHATGSINTTGSYTGGLVGLNWQATINNSYAASSIITTGYVTGGLVGRNWQTTISNSYATGSINTTGSCSGGLVGDNSMATISNSYATGKINASVYSAGGLVGVNDEGMVVSSFWDIETSGIDSSVAGIGKTTAEMKTKNTFTDAGWNFDVIWDITTGYPVIDVDTNYRPTDTDGDGSLNIKTLTDLRWLSESGYDLDKNWELDNNINASDTKNWNSGLGFSPILTFTGTLDGKGHQIDSLYISRPYQSNIGLVSKIEGSTCEIKNMGVTNSIISGGSQVGGIVCWNWYATISNSYATVNLNSIGGYGDYVGGLVCWNFGGMVSNSYATGSINSAHSHTGGLVGRNYSGTVSNSYANCIINADAHSAGGLVGFNSDEGMVANSFWDVETSELTNSDGGTGKTTAEMKTKSTFTDAGWDFETIWDMDPQTNDGYPILKDVTVAVKENIMPTTNLTCSPNPCSTSSKIAYSVKNTGFVNIAVYDMLGNEVAVLINNYQAAGTYEIIFNAEALSAGVYFITINAADTMETKKIIVAR